MFSFLFQPTINNFCLEMNCTDNSGYFLFSLQWCENEQIFPARIATNRAYCSHSTGCCYANTRTKLVPTTPTSAPVERIHVGSNKSLGHATSLELNNSEWDIDGKDGSCCCCCCAPSISVCASQQVVVWWIAAKEGHHSFSPLLVLICCRLFPHVLLRFARGKSIDLKQKILQTFALQEN